MYTLLSDFYVNFIVTGLLFTHHCPARCFGMNMPKSRDIQAKIPLPQAIWNFGYVTVNGVNSNVTGLLVIGNIPLKRSIIFYSRIFSAYSLSNFDSIHGSTCDSACVTCTFATWINSRHICCELLITYDPYRGRSTAFNATEQCILSVKSGNSFSEGYDTFFNRIAYCFWQNRAYIVSIYSPFIQGVTSPNASLA